VEQLANDPSKLKLGGETRQISVLFCDIRGFTNLSEQLAPEALTDLLNRFLTPLTEVILTERGTIDKYMGDCIMAFWNAPVDVVDHERRACFAAIKMLDALALLNQMLQREAAVSGMSLQKLRIGIGINSGSALAGNLGSEQRFDYSVLGDSVNLASRLESQSKTYGVDILVSEATRSAVQDLFFLELDLVQVVGKSEPVRIFGLVGDMSCAQADVFIEAETLQTQMLDHYRARHWKEALEAIGKLDRLKIEPLRGYFLMMRRRIEVFENSPPEEAWDGVERRLVK
jgi:adenylate cyclase